MSKQKNEKSVNNSVDRGAINRSSRPKNESASSQPTKQPSKSKLDDYTPPARKKSD